MNFESLMGLGFLEEALALSHGIHYIVLAKVQDDGWAFLNRDAFLLAGTQVRNSEAVAKNFEILL